MEELIFFGVIIFFSIIESIARRRKAKRAGQQQTQVPGSRDAKKEWEFEWATGDEALPTYDEEPSYDQKESYDDRALAGGATRPEPAREPPRPSSQTMLPKDLLEELAGIAGQLEHERAGTLDLPKQSPPIPRPSRPAPVPARRDAPLPERRPTAAVAASHGTHRVHLAHAGYGTDPSSRAPSEQDGLDPLAVHLSEDARAVRRQLLSHRGAALRQAIILQEVLGPPLALREEQGKGP